MIELAVGVVIGAAFGKVIDALVKSMLMPALSYLPLGDEGYKGWKLGKLEVGVFIGEVISFLLIAAVIFVVIVKLLGMLFMKKAAPASRQGVPALHLGRSDRRDPLQVLHVRFRERRDS